MKYKKHSERIDIDVRAIQVAEYIIRTKCTIREAGRAFGVSKSTVFNDIVKRVQYLNFGLYKRAKKVIDYNKQTRHLRGGIATKNKYELEKIDECK